MPDPGDSGVAAHGALTGAVASDPHTDSRSLESMVKLSAMPERNRNSRRLENFIIHWEKE